MKHLWLLILFLGCATPTEPNWLPKVGELVYVIVDGNTQVPATVTKVVQKDDGSWLVCSNEFPNCSELRDVRKFGE